MSETTTPAQPRPKMRYPKGRGVFVRESTVPICLNNNPGAVLLSVLLFWYDHPHTNYDTDHGNDFTMCRTQAAIEEQACHQIDVKTIHDTAVPLLVLLGYLTVIEKMHGNLYTLHMDRIFAAYAAYEKGAPCLKAFLKASLQLESAPIRIPEDQLESILINKRRLYLELERTRIQISADSHCKRGRKPKPKADPEGESAETETFRESIEKSNREGERTGDFVDTQSPPARAETSLSELSELRDRTNHALEEIEAFNPDTWDPEQTVRASDHVPPFTKEQFRANSSIGDVTQENRTSQQTPSGSRNPGAAQAHSLAASPMQQGASARQPGRQFKSPAPQLTPSGARVKSWLETLQGNSISKTPGNVAALNSLGNNPDVTEDSLSITVAFLEGMKFVKERDIAIDAQRLANVDDKLNLSFEKNWPTARKRDGPEEETSTPRPEPEGYYPDYGESLESLIAGYTQREEARNARKEREHHKDRAI